MAMCGSICVHLRLKSYVHIIIPARYASTRLPGKPLLDIAGQSGKASLHKIIHFRKACLHKNNHIITVQGPAPGWRR